MLLYSAFLLLSSYAFAQAPTTPSTNLNVSNQDGDRFVISFTAGNGAKRIIIARAGSAVTAVPKNGADYLAGPFGDGNEILPGQFVVYEGSGASAWITGLSPATTYHLKVFEFNGSDFNTEYLTSAYLEGSGTTLTAPTQQAGNVVFSNVTGSGMTLNWTKGNGAARVVIAKEGSAVDVEPQDLTAYYGWYGWNPPYGQIGTTGNYAVYSGGGSSVTLGNMSPSKTYHFAVFEYNGSNGPVYLRPGATASQATSSYPTVASTNFTTNYQDGNQFLLSFTPGDGQKHLVIARKGSPVTAVPADGVEYTYSGTFGSGQEISPGEFVVSTASSAWINGLSPASTYYFRVFEYNGSGANTFYLTSSYLEGSGATVSSPTVQASGLSFSGVTGSGMTLNWTKGNGAARVVIAKEGSAVDVEPQDLTAYYGWYGWNPPYGQIGTTGNYAVYSGGGSSVTLGNMSPSKTYHFAVFEYNGSNGPVYLRPGATASQATSSYPTVASTNFTTNYQDGNQFLLSFTPGDGQKHLVIARKGSPVTAVPADGVEYTYSGTFGSGQEISPGEFVVNSGTGAGLWLYGLEPASTYHFRVYEYNGSGTNTFYLTSSYLEGSGATVSSPTVQSSNAFISSRSTTSINVSWTKGNGSGRILIARKDGPVNVEPEDLKSYYAYGYGQPYSQIGTGNYVVYSGAGNNVNITNLEAGTNYHFALFEYNGSNGPVYLKPGYAFALQTFGERPTIQVSNAQFSNVDFTSFDVSFTKGNGSRRLVLARAGAPVNAGPADFTSYTSNSTFGLGQEVGPGNFVVYNSYGENFKLDGLTPGVNYHFAFYEYAVSVNGELYMAPAYTAAQASKVEYSITVGNITNQLCAGQPVEVPYTVSTPFGSNNVFTAELSDASGSFNNPVIIGSLTSNVAGTIMATIPASATAGTNYRIRITASSPTFTSAPNSTNLSIQRLPSLPGITGDAYTCTGLKEYSVSSEAGVTYTWNLSGGGSLTATGNTASVTWHTAGSHTLTMTPSNACGDGEMRTLIVNVYDASPTATPTISPSGRWMYASQAPENAGVTAYQWHLNGAIITRATSSSYYAYEDGAYTVRYTNPCGAGPESNTISYPNNKLEQTITFAPVPEKNYGDDPFDLIATASSGLPVSFMIVSGPGVIDGNTLTITGAGTIKVEATQAGNDTYEAATPVNQDVLVAKASQAITFAAISDKTYGDSPFELTALASSGLPVTFKVVNGYASILDANVLSIDGIGSVTVQAIQEGNENYLEANSIEQTFCVNLNQLVAIAGNKSVCTVTENYNVPDISGATYQWKLNGGGAIESFGNTATVNWTTPGNFTISVIVSSDCGNEGLTSNLNVTVKEPIVPDVVTNLLPANGSVGLALPLSLSWKPSANADTYDLYIWPDSVTNSPAVPFAKDLREINYTISKGLDYGTWYNWQVIARNGCSNSQSTTQRFILRHLPDLNVHSVQAPESAIAGSNLGVRWKISNIGYGSTQAEAWSDEVYLSADTVLNVSDDILLGKTPNVTYLQPGQVYNGESNLRIPVTVFGQFFVFVRSSGSLLESNKHNNVARSQSLVPITVVPLPDLRPNTIAIPATAFGNDSVTVTYSFKNEGNSSIINKGWVDQVFISPDSNFVATGSILIGSLNINGLTLPKDSSYTQRHKFKIPHQLYGNYYVHVLANTGRSFEEISRANNGNTSRLINVKLRPPVDLVVSNVSAPATVLSGFPVQVSWQVQNQGANGPIEVSWTDKVYISKASIFDINKAAFIGKKVYTRKDAFLPDAIYTQTSAFKMPDSLSGKFYVYVITDADSSVFEYTFKENNIARTIQPITVNYAYADLIGLNGQLSLDTVTLGETVSVSWITENRGPNTALATWVDDVYLSRDKVISPEDIKLGDYNIRTDILAGGRLTNTASFIVKDAFQGDYYVLINTDALNNVLEFDADGKNLNDNNVLVLTKPVYVKGYGVSDLAVKKFVVGDPVFSGQSLVLSWQVENLGSSSTVLKQDYWQDRVYLSADSVANPFDDILLTAIANNKLVGPGESYERNTSVKMPNDKLGSYYLILQTTADAINSNDINGSNNVKVLPIVISLTDPSDLVVEQVSPPQQVIAGEQLLVPYIVKNKGIGVTNESGWRVRMYLSSSSNYGAGSLTIEVGSKERKTELTSNTSYTDSMLVNIPPYLSGTYYLIAFADAGNKVYEHQAEGNNTTATLIEILPPVPSDFVVTKLEMPTTIGLGDDLQSAYTIMNVGTGRGLGILKDGLYFSSSADATLDTNKDKLLGVSLGYVDLQPGQATERIISNKVKDIDPGNYVGITSTDILNQILESDDNNNSKVAANNTSVTISELILDVEKTALLNKDDYRYFKIEVAQDLDLLLTLTSNQAEGQNKIFIAYNRVPTSSDFDYQNTNTVSTNQQVFVPATKAGTYYVLMQTETEFKESQEVKILVKALPFSILSITPNKVGQGRVTTTLTGARFNPDTKIYLENNNGEKITEGTVVQFTSSMQMRIRWNLGDTPIGKYTVLAVNGDKETVLEKGLEVEAALVYQIGIQEQVPELIRLGGSGHFSFRMENISNVDIPNTYVVIEVPTGTRISNYTVDDKSLTDSRVEYSIDSTVVEDWQDDEGTKFTTSLIKDLSPGDVFTANFNATPSQSGVFETSITGLAFSRSGYVERLVYEIEEVRMLLINEPLVLDAELVALIQNPVEFRNSILNVYINAGILEYKDIEEAGYGSLNDMSGVSLLQASSIKALNTSNAQTSSLDACYCDKVKIECLIPPLIEFGANFPAILGRIKLQGLSRFVERQIRRLVRREVRKQQNQQESMCDDLWACRNVPPSGQGWGVFAKNARRADQVEDGSGDGSGGSSNPCNPKPPVPPTPNTTITYPTRVIRAGDPNDITGPMGHGLQRLVSGSSVMPYTIRFENDPKIATTAAQLVTISLPLDEELNPLSLRVGTFGFSGFSFQVPDNIASYTKVLNLPDSIGYDVELTAGIDVINKEAFWTFQTIDPRTGLPPLDPLAGFLPVNDSTGRGEGFVTYAIRPKSNVQTGDTITAQATIVFDIEDPISTNVWLNVLDTKAPVTTVAKLPDISPETLIPIKFSGNDDFGGSGIDKFVLYYSKDSGSYINFGEFGLNSEAMFKGESGSSYKFFSIGIDKVGNVENMKMNSEASTSIPPGNRPPIFKLNNKAITEVSIVGCVDTNIDQCISVTDPEQDAISYSLVSTSEKFVANFIPTGLGLCLNVKPNDGYSGIDTLQVQACDSVGNCSLLSVSINVGPVVSLTPFNNVSVSTPPFQLTGGLPLGGIYTGPGVTDGKFNPAAVGVGTFELVYTVLKGECSSFATTEITVLPDVGQVTITSFTPAIGPPGTLVTVYGSNFTGATAVDFNGVSTSNFTVISDTEVTGTVPSGATTGKISVVTPAGTATSTDDFTIQSVTTPVITWVTPQPITYGTALSAIQLNATANVAGAFEYIPAAGTVLNAGEHTLSLTFTPEDQVNYTTATKSVTITLNKATPDIIWSAPSGIAEGTALSDTQLNATASFNGNSVPGTFTYTPTAGTILPAGNDQELSVAFVPQDEANYIGVPETKVKITVNGAPVLTVSGSTQVNEGALLTRLSKTTDVNGDAIIYSLVGTVPDGASIDATTGTVTWTPSEAQGPGQYTLTVRATDNGSPAMYDEESATITVSEVNEKPVLATIGNKTIAAGVLLSFTLSATDADIPQQSLQYLASSLPDGASLNSTSGEFSWMPAANQAGTYQIIFGVTDGLLTAEETITITVTTPDVGLSPIIKAISPNSGPVGTVVSISGSNFTGVRGVAFNGIEATVYTVDNASSITATVPNGATTGYVSVATSSGTAVSKQRFTVTVLQPPSISSFKPSSGPIGTEVTISGKNFLEQTTVSFAGVTATEVTVLSPTSLTARVPAGAKTGAIRVTTSGGSDTSKKNFTVTGSLAASPVSSPQALQIADDPNLIAYPNPFTGATKVRFALKVDGAYTLALYDVKGALVRLVKAGEAIAGERYEVEVDGKGLSVGTYLLRLQSKEGMQTIRLVFEK